MTTRRRPPGDYPVGYGKPPEHGKIKPGERRNPSGRPRRPRAPDDIARKFLSEKIPVIEAGKRRYMTRYEANFRNLYQMALKGNFQACKEVYQIANEIGLPLPPARDMKLTIEFVESDGKGGLKVCDPFNPQKEKNDDK